MYKLEPDDIQGMLADAARVLTKPKDKEVMRRLVESARATKPHEWDRRRIAAMLAKAGKMHEAEMVVNDLDIEWERADALLQMSRALKEIGDDYQSRCVLHIAVMQAKRGQESETEQERLDASAVLSEAACFLHTLGEETASREVAEQITNESRRSQFYNYLREIESQQPANENSEKSDQQQADS